LKAAEERTRKTLDEETDAKDQKKNALKEHAELDAPVDSTISTTPIPSILVKHARKRVVVQKQQISDSLPICRSPCVAASQSPGEGAKHRSPRVSSVEKSKGSASEAAPARKKAHLAQNTIEAKQPVGKAKQWSGKGIPKGAAVKVKKSDGKWKKVACTVKMSIQFEDVHDFMDDEEVEVEEVDSEK